MVPELSKKSKGHLKPVQGPTEEEIMKNTQAAYLVKFGNIYISKKDSKIPKVDHCYSVRCWLHIPKKGKEPFEIGKLVSCFEKSPQVEKVTLYPRKIQVKWRGLHFDPSIRWHFRPLLRFNLNLPFKNQDAARGEKETFGDRMEEVTKFTVFYDGSNYIITAKVKDVKKYHCVSDVRDLLKNLLKEEFNVEAATPNPMRENYYLLFLSGTEQMVELESVVKTGSPNRFLLPRKEKEMKKKDEILSRLLLSCSIFLDTFYVASMIGQNLRLKYVEVNKLHMDIQKKSKELFTMPTRSFLKRRKLKKQLEAFILKHYEIVLDFNICENLVKDARIKVAEQTEHLSPFNLTADRLIEASFRHYPLNVDLFTTCLEYTKKIMERTFSWRLAMYATIFGTISSLLIAYGPDLISFLKDLVTSASS